MANLTFSYTASVPEGSQQINQTQAPINYNFQDIDQLIAVDHTAFNTVAVPNANVGLHNKVTYFAQSSDPTPVANAINLYSKALSTSSNGYELFYQYPNGTVYQLTGSSYSSGSSGSGGAIIYSELPFPGYTGYQYIGGNILMKFGITSVTLPANNAFPTFVTNFAYPVDDAIPVFTSTPFFMSFVGKQLSTGAQALVSGMAPVSATQYSITYTNFVVATVTETVQWLAIGV